MNRASTIKDVATAAGVSPATVSLVLNGKGKISPAVRTRVHDAVTRLGYHKNPFAVAMITRTSSNIAVLISEDYEKAFEWVFIRNMFIQLHSVLKSQGYYPILIPVSMRMKVRDILEEVLSSGVCALFSIHFGKAELFRLLEDHGIPVVLLNNADYQESCYTVCSDDFHGAYEGALHLLRNGHREIAFIDYERPDFKTCRADRFVGFKKALDEYELALPSRRKVCVNVFDTDDIQQKVAALVKSERSLTGIFAHDDYVAAKVVRALQVIGRRIPDDLSLVAPGDVLDYKEPFIPRISTMQIDNALLGRLAGELMMKRIAKQMEESQVLKIRQRFVDRGSIKSLRS